MSDKKIWALLDERAGNTSQTLGVAESLDLHYEIKHIAFNGFIKLPNIIANKTMLGFSGELSPPWPDITISTARRLGIVASYIKSQHPQCFTAQIQWPGFPAGKFDLIATPMHDGIKEGGNIFLTVGAPHRVTEEILAREAAQWHRFKIQHGLPAPKIALLIGGGGGTTSFAVNHAEPIARYASALAQSLKGSLLITTSRRTGKEMEEALPKYLTCPYYLHKWNDNDGPEVNPYYGFLGLADAIIVTGDSVSMCSEACATGKPVVIYATDDFVKGKHKKFVHTLYERGLATPLQATGNTLKPPSYRLNDAISIAEEIKKRAGI